MPKLFHENLMERFAHAVACLDRLLAQLSSRTPSATGFDTARAAVEALPLNTEEVAAVRNRLNNARTYSDSGEQGAACYELRLLARGLALIESAVSGDR